MTDYQKYYFKKGLKCKHCGKALSDKNKTGSCAHCRMTIDQRGVGNHRFGKKLTDEEKSRCAEKTRTLWKQNGYREKVIANATGLHRGEEFSKGQSIRTKASYDRIDGLREQRGSLFSQCWKDGRNHFRTKKSKKSREEREIFEYLKTLGKYCISDDEICIGDNKYIAPDMIVNGKVVVEFYGDYFHANPLVHKADEYIVKKGMTAKELWGVDDRRKKCLESVGYHVLIVWQHDYRIDKTKTLLNLVREIDLNLKG